MHFVDARLAQLQLTKKDAASRGFPDPSTLPRARDTDTQATPTVRTLLRIDATLGWQPRTKLLEGIKQTYEAARPQLEALTTR